MSESDDGFLSRWARRKARVQSGVAEPAEPAEAPAAGPSVAPGSPGAPASAVAAPVDSPVEPVVEAVPLPTMEDVALLTRSSDYSRFVGSGVDPGVSNAAMKKLFSDPHFNVMDGLDTYIDDYGKPDPIPLSMLRQMNQARFLGLFDDEASEAGKTASNANPVASAPASTDGAEAPAVAESATPPEPSAAVPETRPDDDPDLRLQQDDAAGRPGPAPGSRA
ncbi:MAG: DUF3306 domain-containing protein [Caldimonas sp.]